MTLTQTVEDLTTHAKSLGLTVERVDRESFGNTPVHRTTVEGFVDLGKIIRCMASFGFDVVTNVVNGYANKQIRLNGKYVGFLMSGPTCSGGFTYSFCSINDKDLAQALASRPQP